MLEHGVNNSDHFPLICTFEGVIYDGHLKQKFDVKQKLCIDWNVVNIEKYRHETARKFGLTQHKFYTCLLNGLGLCKTHEHRKVIDNKFIFICELMKSSANVCKLQKVKKGSHSNIRWNEELTRARQKSIDIHELWNKCDRPRTGIINRERIAVKAVYKKLIKCSKEEVFRSLRVNAIYKQSGKSSKEFWQAWKILFGGVKSGSSEFMNGCENKEDECEDFRNYFMRNFIDSNQNVHIKNRFQGKFDNYMISDWGVHNILLLSLTEVENAIDGLKLGKGVDADGLKAEHIKFACPEVGEFICDLLNDCLKHSYVLESFGLGIICPTPQKAEHWSAFTHFRPITIVSIISKVFESCLNVRSEKWLNMDDLRFGFTKDSGCQKALFVLRSLVDYFTTNGSNVYLAAWDISRAYDSINHFELLRQLICIRVPKSIIVLLMDWHGKIKGCVKWEGMKSDKFVILSGVKQGSKWSPWLYNVLMKVFIQMLRNRGFGCMLADLWVGCICYAGDVLLLSASIVKLQAMLDVCSEFSDDVGLLFNAVKSNLLVNGVSADFVSLPEVFLHGELVFWKDELMYNLGICLIA